jgi:prepilin-type N-terminal cleavage/methylation domain-containing protein
MRVERPELRVESRSRRPVRSRLAPRACPLTPDSRLLTPLPRGLTLIELLVVIIILTTLVSAAIPIMAPTNDDRRLREASRGVNSFIAAAQMKAVQQQRPFGVAIKRLSKDTNSNIVTSDIHEDNAVAIELFYVEQPAPYRGFDRTSSVMVARHPLASRPGEVLLQFVTRGLVETNDDLPVGWDADLFPPGVIRPNDVIEIDGTQYQLSGNRSIRSRVAIVDGFYRATGGVTRIDARPINDTGQMINSVEFDDEGLRMRDLPSGTPPAGPNRPYWTSPMSYQILRQPMPTSNEPFQMPEGTAIDLRASGVGRDDFFYVPGVRDNSQGILIMFAPEGRVSRVSFSILPNDLLEGSAVSTFDRPVTDNIFLLVGRRENAPPPAVGNDPTLTPPGALAGKTEQQIQEAKEPFNWLRGESRWIVIGSQSGRVVTTENAFVNPQAITGTFSDLEIKRTEQIRRAREFARQMVQVGGR